MATCLPKKEKMIMPRNHSFTATVCVGLIFTLIFSVGAFAKGNAPPKNTRPKIVLGAISDSPDPFSPAVGPLTISSQYRVLPTDSLVGTAHGKTDKTFYIRQKIEILNTSGAVIRTLKQDFLIDPTGIENASEYVQISTSATWNGKNKQGTLAPDGSYTYKVSGIYLRVHERDSERLQEKEIASSAMLQGDVSLDATAPATQAAVSPAPNEHGWHKVDVAVDLTATDNLSGVAKTFYKIGEADPVEGMHIDLSDEGVYSISYWSVDNVGNVEQAKQITVRIDKTAPVLSAAVDPEPNEAGWNNTDPTITFSAEDQEGLSGVASVSNPVTVTTEGKDQEVTGNATDNAGNNSTLTVTVSLDKTSPLISEKSRTPANKWGWNNGPVTVTYEVSDATSGVDEQAGGYEPDTVETEGANQQVEGSVTDLAGNTASITVDGISIDLTAPTITAEVTPEANAAGWHNTDPTITFSAVDQPGLSGVASVSDPVTVTTEGADREIMGSVTDNAGNTSQLAVSVSLDKTPPTIIEISPEDGTIVDDLRQVMQATFADSLSSINQFATQPSVNGYIIDGDLAATYTASSVTIAPRRDLRPAETVFRVQVFDFAGNTAQEQTTFTVGTIPEMTFNLPSGISTMYTAGPNITITGELPSGVASIRVEADNNAVVGPIEYGSFSVDITVELGVTTITFYSVSASGQEGDSQVIEIRRMTDVDLSDLRVEIQRRRIALGWSPLDLGGFGWRHLGDSHVTEPFDDLNGNHSWDPGENFHDLDGSGKCDCLEPFADADDDGVYDSPEPFDDTHRRVGWITNPWIPLLEPPNGIYDEGEFFRDLNGNWTWTDGEYFADTDGDGAYGKLLGTRGKINYSPLGYMARLGTMDALYKIRQQSVALGTQFQREDESWVNRSYYGLEYWYAADIVYTEPSRITRYHSFTVPTEEETRKKETGFLGFNFCKDGIVTLVHKEEIADHLSIMSWWIPMPNPLYLDKSGYGWHHSIIFDSRYGKTTESTHSVPYSGPPHTFQSWMERRFPGGATYLTRDVDDKHGWDATVAIPDGIEVHGVPLSHIKFGNLEIFTPGASHDLHIVPPSSLPVPEWEEWYQDRRSRYSWSTSPCVESPQLAKLSVPPAICTGAIVVPQEAAIAIANRYLLRAEAWYSVGGNGIWGPAEHYTDENGNGHYNDGELFSDANGNGQWDDAEEYHDTNGNGQWDDGEPFLDNDGLGTFRIPIPFVSSVNQDNKPGSFISRDGMFIGTKVGKWTVQTAAPPGGSPATGVVYVVKPDLEMQSLAEDTPGTPPPHETDPGAFVCLNDNDNAGGALPGEGNGIPDMSDPTPLTHNDDDLVRLNISLGGVVPTTGGVSISTNTGNIRIWKNKRKEGITPSSWDLSDTSDRNDFLTVLSNGLWIEGAGPSHNRHLTLLFSGKWWHLNRRDEVQITVVKLDIDTDTNNDGTIDSDDTGEDGYEEYDSGRIVCLDRAGDGANLDDLAEINLDLSPGLSTGTVTLEASVGGSRIKIWTSASKTAEVSLPKTYSLGADTVPASLWADGIDKGQVILDLYYKDGSGTEIYRDKIAMFVTETISWAPSGTFVYSWEPCRWPFGTPGRISTIGTDAVLDNVKDHGWDVTTCRYSDTTGNDDDVNDCTLAHCKRLKYGGVMVVDSHGRDAGIAGEASMVYRTTQAKINDWIDGEANMVARQSSYWGWYASVAPAWFSSNWKTIRDQNKAITIFFTCYSAKGGQAASCVGQAGGRAMFGYTDDRTSEENEDDMNRLLGRMNGSLDNASRRTAGKAYEGGTGYTTTFTMYGNNWTTLHPAPNHIFPAAAASNRKGAGSIVLDTYMDNSFVANEAVTVTAGTISGRRWFGNASGKYGVSFDFDKTGGGGHTAHGEADKCKNKSIIDGVMNRKMAGDRKTYGQDKDWSF